MSLIVIHNQNYTNCRLYTMYNVHVYSYNHDDVTCIYEINVQQIKFFYQVSLVNTVSLCTIP